MISENSRQSGESAETGEYNSRCELAPPPDGPERILLVDDDQTIRFIAKAVLEAGGYEVAEAGDGLEFLESFERVRPDLILLDIGMPRVDGFTACKKVRESALGAQVPILMMTGFNDLESVTRAYESGATDFVGKPVNWLILRERVKNILRASRAEKEIRFLAYYDALTRLPNRILLAEHLRKSIAAAERDLLSLAVLFFDLDRFKNINDTFGHSFGDRLLIEVANRLKYSVRRSDLVARFVDEPDGVSLSRFGGDEFILLLTGFRDTRDVAKVAERLLADLSVPFVIEGNELSLTASVGISLYPFDGTDIENLLRNADSAMYHSKEASGRTYRFYSRSMNADALRELTLESDLVRSLERNEMIPYYQPLLETQSGRIVGFEVLLRWIKADGSMVSPVEFIPAAERSGFILELGDWVLRSACAQSAAWRREGLAPHFMAVNLSALQFRQENLAGQVASAVSACGLGPAILELEITESIVMRDEEEALARMRELNEIGASLSLDDFGTGYSSLSYLRNFPIRRLKIDRSFVKDMSNSQSDLAIPRAIIDMAHHLNLQVVAEGVETLHQLEALRRANCDFVQGFYFSKPVPATEAAALLRQEVLNPELSGLLKAGK